MIIKYRMDIKFLYVGLLYVENMKYVRFKVIECVICKV